jgi:glutamyl aminopeptidase
MCRGEWQYLVDRFTLNDRYLGRLIPVITETFTSELKLKEVRVVCFANILRP